MYSIVSFGHMALDGLRMDAYARAIASTVKPGDVVVDLGAGPGIFALLAARAGARRVHAIDVNPAVWLARDLAAENGLADRVEVHHASSWDVELPERANVIISDLRGTFPLYEGHVATLVDVKTRWLAPGGTLLPARDRFRVALVEAPDIWRDLESGWRYFEDRGFAAAAARASTLNTPYSDSDRAIPASHVLTSDAIFGEIDYGVPFAPTVERTVDVTTKRGGVAHGLCIWFDATVVDGISYSTAPGNVVTYKRTFLPLLEPVRLEVGEQASLTIRVDVRGRRWAWDTEIRAPSGGARARFRQASFLGEPTSPETMLRESAQFSPSRSEKGERVRRLLEQMDGKRTVAELAQSLVTPSLQEQDALDDVREIVARYGR
jgi:protein arginine N-methyltransferase 1